MGTTPAIIVIAYNRPKCLQRLLASLADSIYPGGNVPLFICIDKSDTPGVEEIAQKFDWRFGHKEIIAQPQRLGLKAHVMACAELSQSHGPVILLEDDLLVSPHFYNYALSALAQFKTDNKISGISLYSYTVTENEFRPFYPVNDGSSTYFMQLPSSWGQLFTAEQWKDFSNWYKNERKQENETILPDYVKRWSQSSWKKHFVHYMIERDKFFVFPRQSYTTNFSEEGENAVHPGLYQVPLAEQFTASALAPFHKSGAVYDSSFELLPSLITSKTGLFEDYDYEVDLLGTKNLHQIEKPFLLSSKICNNPLKSFGNTLAAPHQNIIYGLPGNFFHFGKTEDFVNETPPFSAYHVSVTAVKEKFLDRELTELADQKAHSLFDEWCSEFLDFHKLNTESPFIQVLLIASDNEAETAETIQSVHKQQYAASQYHIAVFSRSINNWGANTTNFGHNTADELFHNFRNAIAHSKGQYFVIAKSGDVFFEKSFSEVNHIFRKYPDINWLTGIQTLRSNKGFNVISGTTPARRWNRHIFERNLYKNAGRSLSPASTFWKKYLWDIASPSLALVSAKSFFDDLWLAFFKVQELYTCDVYLSSTRNFNPERTPAFDKSITAELVEDGVFNKMQEFLFVNNVPYLRAYYKSKNYLPPVVRYDHKSKSYFLSDY
ncbi:MAG: glycosyltransferase [Chitinophagales bacterium]